MLHLYLIWKSNRFAMQLPGKICFVVESVVYTAIQQLNLIPINNNGKKKIKVHCLRIGKKKTVVGVYLWPKIMLKREEIMP